MVRRSYKFTDKKHTKQGLMSVACAAASLIFTGISLEIAYGKSGQAGSIVGCGGTALILTAASLSLAYQRSGQAGSIVSLLGVFAMLASVVGFVLALRGFQEEDVYVISSQIGVVVDGLLFILWAMVCVIGM